MKKIVISGSIKFMDHMHEMKQYLMSQDFHVILPTRIPGEVETSEFKKAHNVIKEYYEEIKTSNALLVANHTKNDILNYIGGNTLLEMGFAFIHDIPIFLLNPIPEMQYTPEIEALSPIILDGDYQRIVNYL
jgi:hypothetical protein